ncbi:hypothetical protein [Lactobacillus sp. PSON]|uniref:hypothetical protein n=1 Tax=Lactobacillus sp. PSON TaxID=3455454 RepID=UPI0040432A4E
MYKNKKFDLSMKIILSFLAVFSGIITFVVHFPGKTILLSIIYGLFYFIAAVCFWFQNKANWIRIIMEISLVITFILSLMQSMTDMPLGIPTDGPAWILTRAIIMALPSILGLIYFNLDSFSNGQKVLLVFLRLFVTFIFAYLAFITLVILIISGAYIYGMPGWMQNIMVVAFYIIAIYYVIYIICNWLKFYQGIITWIMTIVALVAFIPVGFLGGFMISDFWWLGIIAIIVLFTAYWNNRVKS